MDYRRRATVLDFFARASGCRGLYRALPGFIGLCLAKAMGKRMIWLDSIANAEQLSMSGRRIGAYADLWLTQWPHLAEAQGPEYAGQVL